MLVISLQNTRANIGQPESHLAHSLLSDSLNAIVRSIFPVESRI
jgi:hypothetical protein